MLDTLGHPEQNTIPGDFTVIIGTDRAAVKEVKPFAASGEGIAYTLLVENSRSISLEDFAQTQQIMTAIVTSMSPKDQACILTFGREATMVQNFTGNKELLKEKLTALVQTEETPRLYQGLTAALQAAYTPDKSIPSRRAVIMTADGTNDSTGNAATKQDVLKSLRHESLPIYVISFFNPALANNQQAGLDALNELVRYSGGALYQSHLATFPAIYHDLFTTSRAGFIAYLTCPPLQGKSDLYKIQLAVQNGDKLFTDTVETQITPTPAVALVPEKAKEPEKSFYPWQPFACIPLVLLVCLAIIWQFRRHAKKPVSADIGQTLPPETSVAFKQTAATALKKEQPASRYCPPPQASSPQGLHLLLTALPLPPETFTLYLADSITVGSDAPSHLILKNDKDISTLHCKFLQRNSKLYITDLGSAHGTFVNNILIKTRIQLQNGDVVRIVQTELQVIF